MRARSRLTRGGSGSGSWEMAVRAPEPPGVLRYVGYRERGAEPVRRREVPQPRVSAILNLGEPLTVEGPRLPRAARGSFVAPLGDAYGVTEFAGEQRGIQVDLSPLAAASLFGMPMRELTDAGIVDLEDLLGAEGPRLLERLHEAPDWDARFDVLDGFLASRLDEARRPPPDVAWAWRRLGETHGAARVRDLASELGCSRRHLVARFRDHVGPAPKTAARVLRFRRLLALLERDGAARLAELAPACGYYDQPHLNREFRELAGTTPREYLAARLGPGPGVTA